MSSSSNEKEGESHRAEEDVAKEEGLPIETFPEPELYQEEIGTTEDGSLFEKIPFCWEAGQRAHVTRF